MHLKRQLRALSVGLALVAGQGAFASGYEKTIMIGGRSAGLAGIATPFVGGAESLYFNPAGLATEKIQSDLNVNISPLTAKFDQPSKDGERMMLFPFGLQFASSINKDWGYGVGVFTSGGASAEYKNVSYSNASDLREKTDLQIGEVSAGLGYRVNDRFKIGAAYRVVLARAEFQTVATNRQSPSLAINVGLKDLEDTQWNGFKLGGQYRLGEKTHLGLTYRSPIFLEAKGKFMGKTNALGEIQQNSATAKTVFPEQVTLGAMTEVADHWGVFGEYAWTNYSRVRNITVNGDFRTNAQSFGQELIVQQNWRDQHNVRVAAEYTGWHMPLRFGYGWTSTVTAPEWARGTFTPPGPTHTVTVGSMAWLSDNIKLDGAIEYTMGSANNNHNYDPGAAVLRDGEFKVEQYAAHLALNMVF